MPLGGRLMFEVASVVVDRKFVAKYPNVRPGAHVLLTVNEVRGAARQDFSAAVRTPKYGAFTASAAFRQTRRRPRRTAGARCRLRRPLVDDGRTGRHGGEIHLPGRLLDRPNDTYTGKAFRSWTLDGTRAFGGARH